ncbi:hypothetical protein B0H14DRAFT_2917677, partial [Mycena olivaceomarginata]
LGFTMPPPNNSVAIRVGTTIISALFALWWSVAFSSVFLVSRHFFSLCFLSVAVACLTSTLLFFFIASVIYWVAFILPFFFRPPPLFIYLFIYISFRSFLFFVFYAFFFHDSSLTQLGMIGARLISIAYARFGSPTLSGSSPCHVT